MCLIGLSEWNCIPQELFQVHIWRLYHKPIQLHCTWGKTLLQAPPHPTGQGERQLQPARGRPREWNRACFHGNCCWILIVAWTKFSSPSLCLLWGDGTYWCFHKFVFLTLFLEVWRTCVILKYLCSVWMLYLLFFFFFFLGKFVVFLSLYWHFICLIDWAVSSYSNTALHRYRFQIYTRAVVRVKYFV